MNATLQKSINRLEKIKDATNEKIAIKVIKRIVTLFPKIKKVQPYVTDIHFGMGHYSIGGDILMRDDENGEYDRVSDVYLDMYVSNGRIQEGIPINKETFEIIELCDFFVDVNGLNFSCMIDLIDHRGVIFQREKNPKSPFGHPPISQLLDSSFYNKLAFSVPVVIEEL